MPTESAHQRPHGILQAAASALARLAEEDQTGSIQGIMLHDGAVVSLCGLLQLDDTTLPMRTRLPIFAALGAIANGNPRCQVAILDRGGLHAFIRAVVSTDEALRNRAVVAILAFRGAVCRRALHSLSILRADCLAVSLSIRCADNVGVHWSVPCRRRTSKAH
jgi:hypothetical protein